MEAPKDFKAVKVQMKQRQTTGETLSGSMLYSGVNVFGQLTKAYLATRDQSSSFMETQPSASSQMGLDTEALQIFKRLQKKDIVTKVKAFADLEKFIYDQEDQEDIAQILTFFLYHFCRVIQNDLDRQVREAAHKAFAVFIKKYKKLLEPHLKNILPLWLASFYDPAHDVAIIARKNFENFLPQQKRGKAFSYGSKSLLKFAADQLKMGEDNVSESSVELTKKMKEELFDRLAAGAFLALTESFELIQ